MMPYSDVFKGQNYNGWHHYAFVWSVGRLRIFIDGKLVCSGSGQYDTATFYMDDLKIWNYAKTSFEL